MKAKLLKKLRKKMYVVYIPAYKEYCVVNDIDSYFFSNKEKALNTYRYVLLRHGRLFYSKYLKKYRVL